MLLPVVSIICWCARSPLMPENRERSMSGHFRWEWGRSAGAAADFRDRGQRHIRVADLEGRFAARELGGGDDTGTGVPVRGGVGDGTADHVAGRLETLRGDHPLLRGQHRGELLHMGERRSQRYLRVAVHLVTLVLVLRLR